MPTHTSSISTILRWSIAHAAIMLVATLTTFVLDEPNIIAIALLLSFSFFIYRIIYLKTYSAIGRWWFLGRANLITLFRLITAIILLLLHGHLAELITALLFLVLLCMDGLDGYIARKFCESNTSGQYLDMETDAATILILSTILWNSHNVNALILLAGSMRYSYVLFLFLLVKQQKLEPKRRYASTVAVIFNLALIVNVAHSSLPALIFLLISSLLLVLSFSRSWFFQLKNTSR